MPWRGSEADHRRLHAALVCLKRERGYSQAALAERLRLWRETARQKNGHRHAPTLNPSTLGRWIADYKAFETARPENKRDLYGMIEASPDLWTEHLKGTALSAVSGLNEGFYEGIFSFLKDDHPTPGLESIKSFEGDYRVYRRAWMTPERTDLAIVTHLRIYQETGVIRIEETQSFQSDIRGFERVDETASGFVIGYCGNLLSLLLDERNKILKFVAIHKFYPTPTGSNMINNMSGNLIGVAGGGPHPGYPFVAFRTTKAVKTGVLKYDEVDPKVRQEIGLYLNVEEGSMLLRRITSKETNPNID